MSMQDVAFLLEKNKEMTTNEIAKELNLTNYAVCCNLLRLERTGEVERVQLNKEEIIEKGLSLKGSKHLIWKINEKWEPKKRIIRQPQKEFVTV